MLGFIAIKAARALATLLICVTAVFVVLRLAGDPADMLLPDDTPAEIKAEYRVRWGLEGTIPEQYWRSRRLRDFARLADWLSGRDSGGLAP
jgi:peptide/nickel transport system permease protein